MIFIKETGSFIKNPNQKLSVELSNMLFNDLEKGHCIFMIPDKFESNDKNFKNAYKVGFLYDLMTVIYPMYSKTEKYQIISEKYHFWFTYRQFKNITDEYFSNRNNYIK